MTVPRRSKVEKALRTASLLWIQAGPFGRLIAFLIGFVLVGLTL